MLGLDPHPSFSFSLSFSSFALTQSQAQLRDESVHEERHHRLQRLSPTQQWLRTTAAGLVR